MAQIWREFCNHFEDKVHDFNFATLLRYIPARFCLFLCLKSFGCAGWIPLKITLKKTPLSVSTASANCLNFDHCAMAFDHPDAWKASRDNLVLEFLLVVLGLKNHWLGS